MISYLYHLIIFNPLYNGLIFLFDIFPWMDAGFAVIIFTIIVRLILFPLSKKAIVTQVKMKEIEPELNRIKNQTSDRQQQALLQMDLYKKKGINPFSSIFLLFLQLPVIYALYYIFARSGLPAVNSTLLYSFIDVPTINMHFLGIFDIGVNSLFLSICAGVGQFLQLHYSFASNPSNTKSDNQAMNATMDMMKNMKYVFPVIIFLVSYGLPAVLAIYWTVSSLFTLGQELVVRKHIRKHQPL